MTTIEPAPRQVAVKVSPEGDKLITSGAHYLRMSKKDLVEAAVEFYLNARREGNAGRHARAASAIRPPGGHPGRPGPMRT